MSQSLQAIRWWRGSKVSRNEMGKWLNVPGEIVPLHGRKSFSDVKVLIGWECVPVIDDVVAYYGCSGQRRVLCNTKCETHMFPEVHKKRP
jgi:hypothetical protein